MILFKNATFLDMNPPAIRPNMDLMVDGDTIKEVGTGLIALGSDYETVNLGGKLLFPGMVCSHHHFYFNLVRGIMATIGPTPDFASILKNLWWRLDRALDRTSLKYSALIGCMDAIRCGTTSVVDHHASPNFIEGSLSVIQDAYEFCGLRGASCYEVTDRNGRNDMMAGIEENRSFAEKLDSQKKNGTWKGLFETLIGGHAPFTLPEEALKILGDVVEKTRRGFHVHTAEDRYDSSHSHAVYGEDLIFRLDRFGLITPKSIMVHGVYLSSEEIALINKQDAFLAHNSRSNMNNNVGYNPRLPEVNNLVIGTDGIGGDMFEEIKFSYFNHKANGGPHWPGDYLERLMTGMTGNKLLGRIFGDSFGKLEPGYKADLVVADYLSPTPLVPENLAGHIVFGMNSSVVESVIIGGRFVYRDRRFPFDVESIYKESVREAAKLWERMEGIAP